MFTRIVAGLLLTITSWQACAGLVSYELDEASGVITAKDRKLEWLQWELTKGMSIYKALETFEKSEWRVATASEVFTLFDDFSLLPSSYSYPHDNNDKISVTLEQFELFSSYFGFTSEGITSRSVQAYFGQPDSDGRQIRRAGMNDNLSELHIHSPGYYTTISSSLNPIGVALVRSASSDSVKKVSEPNPLLIFALGVVFLGMTRLKSII